MSTPPDPAAPACAGCRFWKRNDGLSGECRYNPPGPQPHPAAGVAGRFGVWPLTVETAWCGRFEGRPGGV